MVAGSCYFGLLRGCHETRERERKREREQAKQIILLNRFHMICFVSVFLEQFAQQWSRIWGWFLVCFPLRVRFFTQGHVSIPHTRQLSGWLVHRCRPVPTTTPRARSSRCWNTRIHAYPANVWAANVRTCCLWNASWNASRLRPFPVVSSGM